IPLKEPQWHGSVDFDSLDFGLELEMKDGSIFYIYWGSEFHQYGVSILTETYQHTGLVRIWDVTEYSRWNPLLGMTITSVDIAWNQLKFNDESTTPECPQDLRLTFENDKHVYISALEVWPDGNRDYMKDHITVFFSQTDAEAYNIGPF
ncbi:MAG: hypothetical protein KTR29_21965, partial [Rhodothermaceae bacterium]|nr:hypothetical protein [Rhodothermaceae bacterium]